MQIPQYTTGLVLKRDTPNTVNMGAIPGAGMEAKAVAQVADVGAEIAGQIKHTNDLTSVNAAIIQRKKQDLDLQEQARKDNEANPLGYAKRIQPEYQKMDDSILQTLPSEEAKSAYTKHAGELTVKNYEEDLHWETKRSTEMFANKADQSISDLEVLAYRGTPLDQLKNDRQATTLSLGAVLAPDQIMKFDRKAEERITASYIAGKIDSNPYEAKKLLDSKQYDNGLGAEKLNTLYDQTDSKIKALEAHALAAQIRDSKLIDEDPAQAAIERGANTIDERIAVQKTLGVQPGNIDILSKAQATHAAIQFNGITNADEFVNNMKSLKDEVGADNFPRAMENLKKGGMTDELLFASLPEPNTHKDVINAMFEMKRKGGPEAVKKLAIEKAGGNPKAITELSNTVHDEMAPLVDTLMRESNDHGHIEKIQNLTEQASNLANYFYANGESEKDAVKRATGWLTDKYTYADINGIKTRVVNSEHAATADDVQTGLENKLKSLTKSDLYMETPSNFALEDIKRRGRFSLDENSGGYYLLDPLNNAVIDKQGEALYVSPKEIDDLGGKTARDARLLLQKQREEVAAARVKAEIATKNAARVRKLVEKGNQ